MTPFTITFYSYKGGVGRSLLAANIGVLCARRGKTLLWDLDIEAPGMHNIPGLDPSRVIKEGFFEWLIEWQESKKSAKEADYAKLAGLACQTPTSEKLCILPAFGEKKDFAGLYQDVQWDDFLVRDLDSGLTLFRRALEAFGEAGFETVILDSRTGITDMGGLLAALLPHATVLVGNYGQQNTRGLAHVWKALEPASEGKLKPRAPLPNLTRILVASPISEDDVKRKSTGESIWEKAFGINLSELVTIPFNKELLFTEDLYAKTLPDSDVAQAYKKLASRIEAVRQQVIVEAESERRCAEARPDLVSRPGKSRLEQGKSFEERVAYLLRLLGYNVEREQLIDSNRIDLVARKRADFGREEVYFVECKDHQAVIPKETVQIFRTWLDGPTARQMQARGMVVAAKDFSPAARSYAREQGMQALTYDELERGLFDFSPYLARIRQRYEASPIAATYVDQLLALEKKPEDTATPMLPHALDWISGSGSRLWLVLGDYGTGKSTLVERLAYELARRCETDPESPVPIAVNLRNFPNAISLESLIREHLEAELRAVLNPEIVLHLLDAGRVVLLFDSFDEMGVAQAGRSVEEQFRQLARPTASAGRTARGNRMLITSRSHFFRDTRSARRAVEGGDKLFESDSPLGKAARAFDATIDTLPVFTKAQITDYLHKRLGSIEGDKAERFIEETYGLSDIASTPQLLDMIVASLPDLVKQGDKVTTAHLYLTYTNRWLNTVRLSQGEVNPDHMRELLERMACELWSRPKNEIHYADLAALLRKEQLLTRTIDSERVDLEMRTAAFLVRSADGYYRFSHKSFLEFFFARALFRALKEDRFPDVLGYGRVNQEATDFLLDLVESEKATPDKLTLAIRTILENPYRVTVSENALLIGYETAYHRTNIDFDDLNKNDNLNIFINEQKKIIPPNAQLEKINLSGEYLFGLYIENGNLAYANFKGTTLSRACFNESFLDNTIFDDAELEYVTMINASLINASVQRIYGYSINLTGANCTNANFQGANLCRLNAHFADFSSACLRLTRLADSLLEETILINADLSGATLPRTIGFKYFQNQKTNHKLTVLGISGHGGSNISCAFSSDSARIISAGRDNTIRLWDIAAEKEIHNFTGHTAPINSCSFSVDSTFVLTASNDMTARLWNSFTGKELQRFSGHTGSVTHCAFSFDSTKILTSSKDKTVRLWDASNGKELNRYSLNTSNTLSISFPSEGPLIASKEKDNSVTIWEANKHNTLHPIKTFEDGIRSCSFINNSSILSIIAVYEKKQIAIIYEVRSNKALQVFDDLDLMFDITVSPDISKILIYFFSGNGILLNMRNKNEIHRFENRTLGFFNTFSPDCSQISSINDSSSIRIININNHKTEHFIGCPRHNITAFIFSKDSKVLYTFDNQEIIRRWDISKGIEIAKIDISAFRNSTISSEFSKDASCLATFDLYGNAIIWSTGDGKRLVKLHEHDDITISCAFSPNNTHIITISSGGMVRLWNYITGNKIWEKANGDGLHWRCTFSKDGIYILTTSDNGNINLLDATSGEKIRTFDGHTGNINSCEFSDDGTKIISSSSDYAIRIWDTATGSELFEPIQTTNSFCICNVSPDGSYIISAGESDTTNLISVYNFKRIHPLKGNYSRVTACSFSPDGSIILTTTEDGVIYLWDTRTGSELIAITSSMFSWLSYSRIDNRWDGEGELTEQLRYIDEAEEPTDDPEWVPRNWVAADLPELKGLTPLPELMKLAEKQQGK